MADNAGSVDNTAAVAAVEDDVVVVVAGSLAMLLGIAGIADTAACIAGLLHWQCCMPRQDLP